MFNVRVLDEIKDFNFDSEHHKDRPVQRGLITLKELFTINFILLVILFFISIYSSMLAFTFLMAALVYSMVAGFDFFMGRKIRDHFFIYNVLCLLQLLLFQVHIYLILVPTLNFYDPLLYIHFFFVLANSSVIEVGRKMKVKKNESTGRDTYSSRMGKKKATGLFLAIIILSFLLFVYIFLLISPISYLFLLALLFLVLEISSLILYISSEKVWVEKALEGIGIIFYLSLHVILFFGGIQ